MKRIIVFICAVWMIGVVPNAYGACTNYTWTLPVGCTSDADCEEETPGGPMALACPFLSVDGTTYYGIKSHTFTYSCVRTTVYDDEGCIAGTQGKCVNRSTATATRYACCSGYYGQCDKNTDITTCSCSRCPKFSDTSETVYGTTEGPVAINADNYSGNATSKTDCYVPADTGYEDSDGTGTFEFTSKCYYSN